MKLDRRGFLKFAVGGAIGTLATPIPWDMIDESAKFTDLWAPEPAKGPSSFVHTTCRLCPGGCGITLRLVEDKSGRDEWRGWHHKEFIQRRRLPSVPLRAVKISGNPGHPVNGGGICPLGAAGLQILYGASRITTPLKRTNSKEEDKATWEKISWDEALNIVGGRLREIREAGQPHTVACILDSKGGIVPGLVDRFFRAYGSSNVMTMPSQEDVETIGLSLMQGTNARLTYDLENSKCVLSFGAALLEGWGAPLYNLKTFAKWQEMGEHTLVQVEPNCSITASKADRWIAVKPGTEAALALGMANVIVQEGLYNQSFVAHCQGFDKFKTVLAEYDLGKVSNLTGISQAVIAGTARQFAVTRPSVAVSGRGQGAMSGNLAEFMSIYSLNALVGNIGQKGGVVLQGELPFKAWPAVVTDALAEKGLTQARVDGSDGKYAVSMLHNLPTALKSGAVSTLFIQEANPCYAMPRADKFKKAVAKVPFVVALSSCMNETAGMADVVLPLASYLERLEDVPSPARVPYSVLGLTRPVLANVPEAKHPGDIYLTLAKALGGSIAASMPWDNFEVLLKDKVEGLFAARRGRIGDQEVAALGSADELWEALNAGKCWSEDPVLAQMPVEFNPQNRAANFEPVAGMETAQEYPMLLVAYEDMNIVNRRAVDTPPYLTKNISDTVLQKKDLLVRVNPETAGRLRLAEGDAAVVQCPSGRLSVRVHRDAGIMPGVVAIPLGLGHSSEDPFLAGKGVNAYDVLEPVADPATGLASWWGTRAKLIKV